MADGTDNPESGSKNDGGWTPPPPPSDLGPDAPSSQAASRGVWFLRPAPRNARPYIPATTSAVQQAAYEKALRDNSFGYYTPTQLSGAYEMLDSTPDVPFGTAVFERIAKSISNRKTGSGLFGDLLKEAERINATGDNKVSPFDLAIRLAQNRGLIDESGQWTGKAAADGSGSRSGRRSAPNYPVVSQMPEEDILRMANDTAMALVGRELNKKELRSILKDIRTLELENPTRDQVINGKLVRSGGVSNATIQDLVEERASVIATKGLDAAGPLNADAAKSADELRQWARNNGVDLGPQQISQYTRKILLGETTLDDVKGDLRRTYLTGLYPAWSDRIAAGEDPSDFLNPYVEKAKKLLERDDIGIDDPLVSQMTQYVGKDGKPTVMPLWQAAQAARKDDRWQYTDNAQAEYAKAANDILSMFGMR